MSDGNDSSPLEPSVPVHTDAVPEQQIADLPLFPETEAGPPEAPLSQGATGGTAAAEPAPEKPVPEERVVVEPIEGLASLTNRLGAALLDLAVGAAAAVALLAGAALLGPAIALDDWPAFVLPWVAFSFLYHVIPLAFWGRTPGMASMGITARHLDGGALSLGQAVRRWLATLVTAALVGLPGLLALTGRSATDRASRSITIWRGSRQEARRES